MWGPRVLVLAAVLYAASATGETNSNSEFQPLTAAPSVPDPYLNLPHPYADFLVRRLVEGIAAETYFRWDFARLEAMAKYYRDSGARTPSGTWKLKLLYDGLSVGRDREHPKDEYRLEEAEAKDLKWITAFPKSPTPYIAYSDQLISHAWFFRGGGYAATVSDTASKKFLEYLERARVVLEKSKNVAASDPQWYVADLSVALGEGWGKKQFEPLIAEGLDRFPYYTSLYLVGARFYLPIWGGNIDDLDKFADDAVRRTAAKEGTIIYARIYASGADTFDNMFKVSRVIWPRMFNALSQLDRQYPDPRNDSLFAYFACATGDKIWTAHMMPLIKGAPEFDIWRSQKNIDRCRAWASNKKAPFGESPLPGYATPPIAPAAAWDFGDLMTRSPGTGYLILIATGMILGKLL